MKVFFIPVIDGQYSDKGTVQLGDQPWQEVREKAILHFNGDKDYVTNMMDGRGYIEIPTSTGKFRYVQTGIIQEYPDTTN